MGVFDRINEMCNIIDDYEEEVLTLDKIPLAIEEICQLMIDHSNNELVELKKCSNWLF